jgi:rubrerythrin
MESPDNLIMVGPIRRFLKRLILESAIIFEEKAYLYYQAALSQSVMDETFELLKKLLGEKLLHRIRLEEAQRWDLPNVQSSELKPELQEDLASIDSLEGFCEKWPSIHAEDSKQDSLKRALQREECALRFYHNMALGALPGDLRGVFNRLREDEKRYISWIRKEMEHFET